MTFKDIKHSFNMVKSLVQIVSRLINNKLKDSGTWLILLTTNKTYIGVHVYVHTCDFDM